MEARLKDEYRCPYVGSRTRACSGARESVFARECEWYVARPLTLTLGDFFQRNTMVKLIDIKGLSKGIVGLVDVFSRLAKSIEETIKSGLRSSDAIRRARERRRLRNLLKITAHLYREQRAFTSGLVYFSESAADERGTWEAVKFEILAIRRLLDQLEKYVLPYSDALMVKHRKRYLELLTSLDERRGLLAVVYGLEYEDAIKNRASIAAIGKSYIGLQNALQEMVLEFSALDDKGDSLIDTVGGADSSEALEPLDEPQRQAANTRGAHRRRIAGTAEPSEPVSPNKRMQPTPKKRRG